MSRIYWDTMLFVYWLEDKLPYSQKVASIFTRMNERGDTLCGSVFNLAELLVAPKKTRDPNLETKIRSFFAGPSIQMLPFNVEAAGRFAEIRATKGVTPADSIHLACASAAGIDLFLTTDKTIRKLTIPGISFIDDLDTTALGE